MKINGDLLSNISIPGYISTDGYRCKNLFNINRGFLSGWLDSTGAYNHNDENCLLNGYIPVDPNTDYTFSTELTIRSAIMFEYDANKNLIRRDTPGVEGLTSMTIRTSSNCYYLRMYFNYNSKPITKTEINTLKPQLEKGTIRTKYVENTMNEACTSEIVNLDNKLWYVRLCTYGNIVNVSFSSAGKITLPGWGTMNICGLPKGLKPDYTIRNAFYTRAYSSAHSSIGPEGNLYIFNWDSEKVFNDGGMVAGSMSYIIK